jgi:hypothetical protein
VSFAQNGPKFKLPKMSPNKSYQEMSPNEGHSSQCYRDSLVLLLVEEVPPHSQDDLPKWQKSVGFDQAKFTKR